MSLPHLVRFSGLSTPLTFGAQSDVRRVSSSIPAVTPVGELGLSADILELAAFPLRVEGGTIQDGWRYLPKLLKVVEHAQASQRLFPNLSHRHYGAAVELNNGVEAMGTNVEASRQVCICDLRYAITNAFNQSVVQQSLQKLAAVPSPPQVKTIFLVNADPKGDRPIPCSDCQEWMNSRFCPPDTKVVSLEQEPIGEGQLIRMRTVADMLPLHKGRREPVRMVTELPLRHLPVQMSDQAKAVLAREGAKMSVNDMQTMLKKAQEAYRDNQPGAMESGLKTGVCIKLAPRGSLHSQGRFDWSTRWFEPPDLRAAAGGFNSVWRQQKTWRPLLESRWLPGFIKQRLAHKLEAPDIQAIAYLGDDSNLPSLTSLGRIARRRGSSDTLILTVENDVIHCRTIADFMPEMYQTRGK